MRGELVADQGEDVDVGSVGADQDGEVAQALGVGELDLLAVEGDQPDTVDEAELVRRFTRRCELRQRLLGESRPSGGAESFVHRQSGAVVRFGGGRVAERGGECAEVVVDGGVVGGAAADDHVGAGVRT